jgi:RNA-directed DNA polymerase
MTSRFVQELHQELGLSEAQVMRLIVRSPHTYKVYTIPKKTGGVRVIAQPAKETKAIQHWLIENLFSALPIHSCATAYKKGASIKANASAHAANSYLSKFDFKDFFTSIKAPDIKEHLSTRLNGIYSPEDLAFIVRVSCIKHKGGKELCLSIGAPSSPLLSNSIMYDFDERIHSWCSSKNIVYTRYADDLTFSSNQPGTAGEIERVIRDVIKETPFPKLRINNKKTIHLSKKSQRRVTGIIINNEGKISLGREKKRLISTLIHKFSIGLLDTELHPKLQGLLGFALDVEPLFFQSMKNKYGTNLLDEIMRIRKSTVEGNHLA